MKKFMVSIVCLTMLLGVGCKGKEAQVNPQDKLIRFHVIANSDLERDQNVKLKVRDAILKEVGPKLEKSSSILESEKIILNEMNAIEKEANRILAKEGFNYNAKAYLGQYNFPAKTYGNVTLPSGEYKAFRVVLGEGEGKNWWCVMFPPLCFIDITRGLTDDDTDKLLEATIEEKDNDEVKVESNKKETKINNNEGNKKNEEKEVEVELRFKTVDLIKQAFGKIKMFLVQRD